MRLEILYEVRGTAVYMPPFLRAERVNRKTSLVRLTCRIYEEPHRRRL